jgi:hypothetical protein
MGVQTDREICRETDGWIGRTHINRYATNRSLNGQEIQEGREGKKEIKKTK